MNYRRRMLMKNGFFSIIGLSIFTNGFYSFFQNNTDIDIKTIGNDSFLVNGWLITKNDLKYL